MARVIDTLLAAGQLPTSSAIARTSGYVATVAAAIGRLTLSSLTEYSTHKKTGAIKHSFLGYMFFNYSEFGQECGACTFVSNRGFNEELRTWQQAVRDGKALKVVEPDLYAKLHGVLRREFPLKTDDEFDEVFDVFCQNTRLDECELPPAGYKTHIKGAFFDVVAKKYDIKVSTAKLVITDIWEEIRKKATTLITTPISLPSLNASKGITGDILPNCIRTEAALELGAGYKLCYNSQ